jgi:hypothetical protein
MNVNLAIRFMLETFMEIMFCCFIGLGFQSAVQDQEITLTKGDKISEGFNYTLVILVCIFPLVVAEFTLCRSRHLRDHASTEVKFRFQSYIVDQTVFDR